MDRPAAEEVIRAARRGLAARSASGLAAGLVALGLVVAGLCGCGSQGAPRARASPSKPAPVTDPPTTLAATTLPPPTDPPTTAVPVGPPPAIAAAGWATVPGDGAWRPAGRLVAGVPAVFTTTLHRAGATYGVAWMNQRRLQLVLYAGTSQPAGAWAHDGAVAAAAVPALVAAFNSGFKLVDSKGGWYSDGRAATPLVAGAASLVVRADGTATIGSWGVQVGLTPDVVAVRQNLQLLVDSGVPTAAVSSPDPIRTWGDPLHEKVLTWRSALAIDGTGQLLYVAADSATPADLAGAVVAAGGIRAMELDINPQWVSFNAFSGSGPTVSGAKLLPTMTFPTNHFLVPYFRDFLAVFAR